VFLGLAAPTDYVTACAGIVFETPHHSRYLVPWTEDWIDVVQKRMSDFPFLAKYTFAS